jgi:hypothetical protein
MGRHRRLVLGGVIATSVGDHVALATSRARPGLQEAVRNARQSVRIRENSHSHERNAGVTPENAAALRVPWAVIFSLAVRCGAYLGP